MGNTCQGTSHARDNHFKAPDIYQRNSYIGDQVHTSDDYKRLFSSHQGFKKYSPLVSKVDRGNKMYFQDKNYGILNSTKLSKLYNYEHMKAKVYTAEVTPYNSFDQTNIQFSYLSCVMYLYCTNKFLLDRVFQTKTINDYDFYVLKLFCYGKPCEVVLDDYIPTAGENLQYSKLIRGKQIWPVLIEKAWSKQVGSYEAAKGLSPEDAFEEITGIPAYSYSFQFSRNDIQEILEGALRRDQWVTLIARVNLKDIQNRQVFFLEKIEGDKFCIRSPYNRYQFKNHMIEDSNMVKINLNELLSHFEFYTIGYFHPNFQSVTCTHRSRKRQEIIYQILVRNQELVNIRFVQLFEGYFDMQSRSQYDYSPVFMELYTSNFQLIDCCQGCDRSAVGARASHLSNAVFERLRPGKYYLKLEVDWVNDVQLNQGTLVAYSSRGNVQIRPSDERIQPLIRKFHQKLIEKVQNIDEISQNIQVTNVEKKNGVVLRFVNKSKDITQNLKLDMSKSRNIRFKYCQSANSQASIELKPGQTRSIQILPEDPTKFVQIVPFQVTRI